MQQMIRLIRAARRFKFCAVGLVLIASLGLHDAALAKTLARVDGAEITDDDLKAIYAYLRTVPAIRNHVPNAVPPGSHAVFE